MVLNDKRVLVTGAGGILGYSVLSLVSRLCSIVVPLTKSHALSTWYLMQMRKDCVQLDLSDYRKVTELIAAFEPSVIFHLAANNNNQTPVDGVLDITTDNLFSALSVLEGVRMGSPQARVIIASSVEVSDASFCRFKKMTPYRAAKKSVEFLARAYRDSYDIDVRVLQLPNVYGAGDRNLRRFLPSLIAARISGEPFPPGRLTNSRPFIHGLDAAGMLIRLALQEKRGDVLQCKVPVFEKISFKTLAELIDDLLLEKQVSYSTLRAKLENRYTAPYYFGDQDVQLITVTEGLLEMVAWYRTFGTALTVNPSPNEWC